MPTTDSNGLVMPEGMDFATEMLYTAFPELTRQRSHPEVGLVLAEIIEVVQNPGRQPEPCQICGVAFGDQHIRGPHLDDMVGRDVLR